MADHKKLSVQHAQTVKPDAQTDKPHAQALKQEKRSKNRSLLPNTLPPAVMNVP